MKKAKQPNLEAVNIKALPDRSLDILLDTMEKEFARDESRNIAIETKTGVIISATFAALALIIPYVPFTGIKTVYTEGFTAKVILLTLGLAGLLFSLFLSCYVLSQFLHVFEAKEFKHVNIDSVYLFSGEGDDEIGTKKGLITHYYDMVSHNRKIVDDRMAYFENGLKRLMIAVPALIVSFILVRFVV